MNENIVTIDIYNVFKNNKFFIDETKSDLSDEKKSFLKLRSALGFRMLLFIDSLHDFHDRDRYSEKEDLDEKSHQPKSNIDELLKKITPHRRSLLAVKELFKKVCKDLKFIIDEYKTKILITYPDFFNKPDIKEDINFFNLFEKIINLYSKDSQDLKTISENIDINPLEEKEVEKKTDRGKKNNHKFRDRSKWDKSVGSSEYSKIQVDLPGTDYKINYQVHDGKITILTKDFYEDIIFRPTDKDKSYYTQSKLKPKHEERAKQYLLDKYETNVPSLLYKMGNNLVNFFTNDDDEFIKDQNFKDNSYMFLIILILTMILKDVATQSHEEEDPKPTKEKTKETSLWINKTNLTSIFQNFLLKYTFNCYNLQIKDIDKKNLNSNAILGELCKILCLQRQKNETDPVKNCNQLAKENISGPSFDIFTFFKERARYPNINLIIDAASKNRSTDYIYESALDLLRNNIQVTPDGIPYISIVSPKGVEGIKAPPIEINLKDFTKHTTDPNAQPAKKEYNLFITTATCYDAAKVSNIQNFMEQMEKITKKTDQKAKISYKLLKTLQFKIKININNPKNESDDIQLMDIQFDTGTVNEENKTCKGLIKGYPELKISKFFEFTPPPHEVFTISKDSSSLQGSFASFYYEEESQAGVKPVQYKKRDESNYIRTINNLIGKGMGDFGQILYFYYLEKNFNQLQGEQSNALPPIPPINLFHTIDQWAAGLGSLFTNGIVCEQQSDAIAGLESRKIESSKTLKKIEDNGDLITTDTEAPDLPYKLLNNQFFVSKILKEEFFKILSDQAMQTLWKPNNIIFWEKVKELNEKYLAKINEIKEEVNKKTIEIINIFNRIEKIKQGEQDEQGRDYTDNLETLKITAIELIKERNTLINSNKDLEENKEKLNEEINDYLAKNKELYDTYIGYIDTAKTAGLLLEFRHHYEEQNAEQRNKSQQEEIAQLRAEVKRERERADKAESIITLIRMGQASHIPLPASESQQGADIVMKEESPQREDEKMEEAFHIPLPASKSQQNTKRMRSLSPVAFSKKNRFLANLDGGKKLGKKEKIKRKKTKKIKNKKKSGKKTKKKNHKKLSTINLENSPSEG